MATRPKINLLTTFLILVLITAIGWLLYNVRGQLADAQAEKDRYAVQVEIQKQENKSLSADIAEGPTDEKMAEIARDELDWAYSDEYVFYDKQN